MPAWSGDGLQILSRARTDGWRGGSLMAGGWLVVVGPAWWGSGERVGASGGFSPPCLKHPSVQERRGGGFPCLPFFILPFPASRMRSRSVCVGVSLALPGPSLGGCKYFISTISAAGNCCFNTSPSPQPPYPHFARMLEKFCVGRSLCLFCSCPESPPKNSNCF